MSAAAAAPCQRCTALKAAVEARPQQAWGHGPRAMRCTALPCPALPADLKRPRRCCCCCGCSGRCERSFWQPVHAVHALRGGPPLVPHHQVVSACCVGGLRQHHRLWQEACTHSPISGSCKLSLHLLARAPSLPCTTLCVDGMSHSCRDISLILSHSKVSAHCQQECKAGIRCTNTSSGLPPMLQRQKGHRGGFLWNSHSLVAQARHSRCRHGRSPTCARGTQTQWSSQGQLVWFRDEHSCRPAAPKPPCT